MLEVNAIACVRGNRRLFAGLSFRLDAGHSIRVLGENGAGKTSLLRIIAGLAPADAGEVRWEGEPARALGEDYRRRIAFVGHANALKDDLSALENLGHALALAGIAAESPAMQDAMAWHGLREVAQLPVRVLSQGQKRRAALARLAFCADRPLWILDEPFAALDAASVARLASVLSGHVTRGGMVLFTTHQEVDLGVSSASLSLSAT